LADAPLPAEMGFLLAPTTVREPAVPPIVFGTVNPIIQSAQKAIGLVFHIAPLGIGAVYQRAANRPIITDTIKPQPRGFRQEQTTIDKAYRPRHDERIEEDVAFIHLA